MYNILDFKAVVKHSYYGCKDDEAILCDETGRHFPSWKAAASDFITRYLGPILEEDGPRNLIIAHDMGTDYRTALWPEYKAKRKQRERSPVEDENTAKLYDWVKSLLASLGTTQIGVKGVEADDVIAWLCEGIVEPKAVYSVDEDLLQLANEKTIVYIKGEPHYGEGEHKGIPYHLTSLAKSILGDKSDEYPGVPGLGPVKVEGLIETFGVDGFEQLQDIVESGNTSLLEEAIEQTGDKTLIKLLENFSHWRTMYRLARLRPELCWKPRARKLVKPTIHKRLPNPTRVYQLLKDVGCDDMYHETFEPVLPGHLAVTSENWDSVKDKVKELMAEGDIVAFDYETTDHDPHTSFHKASTQGENFVDVLSHELAGASFCFGKHLGNVIYIPIDHKDSPNLPKGVITELLEHASENAQLVAQNASFEGTVSQTNLHLQLNNIHDTRIMQRYFDENSEAGLKAMSFNYLGYEQASYEDTLAAGNNGEGVKNMSELTLEEVFSYGADDAQVTGSLYDLLKLMLQLDKQWDFYSKWGIRTTEVLQHSYIHGVDINWPLQKQLHERDIATVVEGTERLREILSENVSGSVTPGCESFIEAEKDYIFKAAKAKALTDQENGKGGDGTPTEIANTKLYEWKKKLEAACQYIPYRKELIMPRFALTPKQLTDAATAVGLPPVTKVSEKGINEYLMEAGVVGFDVTWPEDEGQRKFLEGIADALEAGVFKIKTLEKNQDKSDAAFATYEAAQEAFEKFGKLVQTLAGVEAKEIEFGDPLSVGSPAQMQQLMYCKIGVPVRLKGTQVGKGRQILGIREAGPSSDEKAIQTALANDVEVGSWQEEALKVLLEVKSANTRISLYHKTYPLWAHRDGKIHPSITDYGTDTGRPTGSSPNIFQVSKKDKLMRSLFLPPSPDHVVVAIDYNGQELRLLACESNDPVMIDAYDPSNEKDLHSVTGSGIAALKARKGGDFVSEHEQLSVFEVFNKVRKDESHALNPIAEGIRNHAKGCIAAGSLVLTDKGLVPIDFITLDHKVWDGVEFVSHKGLKYQGEREVITVGPLTATPDHEVFLNDGSTISFGTYATQQDGPGLAIGEVEGVAARYSDSYRRGVADLRGTQRSSDGDNAMHSLQGNQGEVCEQYGQRIDKEVQMPADQVQDVCSQNLGGQVLRDGSAVQQPGESVLRELRGTRDHSGISECGSIRGVDADQPSSPGLQGSGDRPDRERAGLPAGEPETGAGGEELDQHQKEQVRDLQGSRGCLGSPVGLDQDGSPGVSLRNEDCTEVPGEGNGSTCDTPVQKVIRGRAKVYDILNAGPRHRFTVSGVIVHNCNFGLAYGAAAPTLSRNLIVPLDEADELLAGTMALYARIPQWQKETADFMNRNGFTLTSFGTKRHATDDIFSKDNGKVSRQHRQGTNATIQGTAAEMLRIVLTKIRDRRLLERFRMVFFAPIYDETVAFVHKDDVVEYCKEMVEIMASATPPTHPVPQVPEIAIGCDWGRVHEVGRWNGPEPILKAVETALADGVEVWKQVNEWREANAA